MRKNAIFSGCLFLCVVMIGCTGMTRLERDYGTSHNLAKYNQILNPEAEKNLAPVEGLDGRAAAAAVEKYHKGFEKPAAAPATSYTVNIGSMSK